MAKEVDLGGLEEVHSGAVSREGIWSTQSDFSQQQGFQGEILQSSSKCDWYPVVKGKKRLEKKNTLEINNITSKNFSSQNCLEQKIYSHLYHISLTLRHKV